MNEPLGSWERADEAPEVRRRVVWAIPTVLAVLGTVDLDDRPHLMNCSWLTPVANEPTRLVVSLESTSKSVANLLVRPAWSVTLVTVEQRTLGRTFVKPELSWRRDGADEFAHDQLVARSSARAPYLVDAAAALAGATATRIFDLGDHELWLLGVDEIVASADLLAGAASQHAVAILGVHDTRMNYGR
jgi:flavin reductase (DIM6/NTAB) family NADH-FMN oxidoreductase RutF